jgi:hypothetical protein
MFQNDISDTEYLLDLFRINIHVTPSIGRMVEISEQSKIKIIGDVEFSRNQGNYVIQQPKGFDPMRYISIPYV